MIKPVNSTAVNESMEDANGMTNVEPTPAAEDNKPRVPKNLLPGNPNSSSTLST